MEHQSVHPINRRFMNYAFVIQKRSGGIGWLLTFYDGSEPIAIKSEAAIRRWCDANPRYKVNPDRSAY
jgi:hypothetical protein